MGAIFDALYSALGWLMQQIYYLTENYGVAIILFTVLTKILLFPLNLKQQKSSAQMQKVKPLLDEAQKKYANNREKLSEETMKIYQEYGISPTGGCLPLIIQLPIIYALYRIIEQPYTYILHWGKEKFESFGIVIEKATQRQEIKLVAEKIKEGVVDASEALNFNFLGLDLSATPEFGKPGLLWAIPICAALLTFLQTKFMYAGLSKDELELKKKASKEKEGGRPPRPGEKKQDANQMGSMTYFMPLMTLFFTFALPAGIGLYWIAGSVVQIALTYLSNKYIIPKMKAEVKGGKKDDIEEIRKKLRENRKNS